VAVHTLFIVLDQCRDTINELDRRINAPRNRATVDLERMQNELRAEAQPRDVVFDGPAGRNQIWRTLDWPAAALAGGAVERVVDEVPEEEQPIDDDEPEQF
jgi:hypothetical protein